MTTPLDNPYQAPDTHAIPSDASNFSEFQFREMKVFAWLAGICIGWALPYSILILLLLTEKISLPMEMLELADLLQLIIFISGVVFYCIWKYRCACNARYFYGGPLLYTPGWCVGYYFIPVMMLFRPYQCMKDIYEKTYLPMGKSAPTGLVLTWWLSWIFSGIFERISMKTEVREIMFINHYQLSAQAWHYGSSTL